MRRLFLVLSLLLIIPIVSAEIVINEIMYNPSYDENYNEWVELYNKGDTEINLSDWKICDDELLAGYINYTDKKTYLDNGTLLQPNQSAIIVDGGSGTQVYDNFNVSESSLALRVDGATICGALSNSGDLILLKDNSGSIIDALSYSDSWGANGNDKSLCKIPNAVGLWQECEPTPGAENGVYESSGCDWKIEILLDEQVSDNAEFQVRVSNLGASGKVNFTVDKWIEDSNGFITKTYSLWAGEATTKKTSSKYKPNLATGDAYFIKANITNLTCEDIDLSNNFISQMVFIPYGEQESGGQNSNSSIQIRHSPSKADFGDIIKVELNLYRGDTSKYAVYAYIEEDDGTDVSEKSTLHLKGKFTNYTLTVPIQLDFNCNQRYKNDNYVIVVEGLGLKTTKTIELDGKSSNCGETVYKENSSTAKTSESSDNEAETKVLDIISSPETVKIQEPFEVKVKVDNIDDYNKEYYIYSYIYKGKNSISEGFLDEWKSGWTANKQKIALLPGANTTLTLKNRIKQGAEPGTYTLKVRAKEGEKDIDATEEIVVTGEAYFGESSLSPAGSAITGSTVFVSETGNRARNIIYLILFISIILNIVFIRASK